MKSPDSIIRMHALRAVLAFWAPCTLFVIVFFGLGALFRVFVPAPPLSFICVLVVWLSLFALYRRHPVFLSLPIGCSLLRMLAFLALACLLSFVALFLIGTAVMAAVLALSSQGAFRIWPAIVVGIYVSFLFAPIVASLATWLRFKALHDQPPNQAMQRTAR